jgi:hypothetical protein
MTNEEYLERLQQLSDEHGISIVEIASLARAAVLAQLDAFVVEDPAAVELVRTDNVDCVHELFYVPGLFLFEGGYWPDLTLNGRF